MGAEAENVTDNIQKTRPDETVLCSTSATVEELMHTISSFRAQQHCLLKALQECQAIVATEMEHMHTKSGDYMARSEEDSISRLLLSV